jgi:hypothetical protein
MPRINRGIIIQNEGYDLQYEGVTYRTTYCNSVTRPDLWDIYSRAASCLDGDLRFPRAPFEPDLYLELVRGIMIFSRPFAAHALFRIDDVNEFKRVIFQGLLDHKPDEYIKTSLFTDLRFAEEFFFRRALKIVLEELPACGLTA